MKNSIIFILISALCALQPCYVGAMENENVAARFDAVVELFGNNPKTFNETLFSLQYIGLDESLISIARGLAQAKVDENELEELKYENEAQFLENITITAPRDGYADYHAEAAAKLFGKDRSLFEDREFLLGYIGFDKNLIRDAKLRAELTIEPEKEYVIDVLLPEPKKKAQPHQKKNAPEKKETSKKQSFWKSFLNNYSRELAYAVPITFGVIGALGFSWIFSRR